MNARKDLEIVNALHLAVAEGQSLLERQNATPELIEALKVFLARLDEHAWMMQDLVDDEDATAVDVTALVRSQYNLALAQGS